MAIKGCARQSVVLRGGSSDIFESAYFIVRADAGSLTQSDILSEANRIVAENCFAADRSRRRFAGFLLGAALGAAAMGLIWLICSLF